MPELINAGTSGLYGASSVKLLHFCDQKWAFSRLLGIVAPGRDALMRGSLTHVGVAHHYARLQARQQGTDPNEFYEPREAISQAVSIEAEVDPEWWAHSDAAKAATEAYQAHWSLRENIKVLGVEQLGRIDVTGHVWSDTLERWVEKTYPFTYRLDLEFEGPDGLIYIEDHKTSGQPLSKRKSAAYAMDLQVLAYTMIGHSRHGERFGGFLINYIVFKGDTIGFRREPPEPAPWAMSDVAQAIVERHDRRERWERAGRDPWRYPKALHEQVCVSRYGGVCEFYQLCQQGPGALR